MASVTAAAATSRQDEELTELLSKLYTFQEVVGAKPASTEAERKAKAATVAVLGQGKKAAAKGSRFLELKSTIVDRLKTIHKLLKETKSKEEAGYGGDNAKEIIALQAQVRETIRQAGDEWNEMDAIYKKEARKKKSKFTPEELEVQSELVRRLQAELEKVKEAQLRGYSSGAGTGRDASTAVSLNTKTMYSDAGKTVCACVPCVSVCVSGGLQEHTVGCMYICISPFTHYYVCMYTGVATGSKKASWSGTTGGAAITDDQRQQILQLEERDADFDRQLDEIGEGIQDLVDIAAQQGEEVKRQAVLLDTVHDKMDRVADRMTGVNSKMKETLDQVGRSSDKLCVDIMCIVLAISLGSIVYKFVIA